MRKRKLSIKVMIGFFILAVILILCTCLTVCLRYRRVKMDEFSSLAFSYARMGAEYIDGDRVPSYVETGVEDDYYQQVQDFLNAAQAQTDLKYYYVIIPYEDDLVYVWDADGEEGARPLGYHEAYLEGGQDELQRVYRPNPAENMLISKGEEYGYIASAYSPIFNSAGEPVALVGVDLSMTGIARVLTNFIVTIIFSVIGVIIIAMAVFYIFADRNIINPINRLNTAANEMVGNLELDAVFDIDIHTGDEIEELANAFRHMDLEVRDYIRELTAVTAEKERIGAELDLAAQIQASMLPSIFPAFPERKELDIYASMDPAKEVGGDFYDFFMVDEKHLAIVVADVSGKGVPAALFMVIGKTLIKDRTQTGKDLGVIFTEVNNLLCESNSNEMFITAFEGVLNLETGEFRFVNAGHEIPFICRKDGTFEPYEVRAGFILGGMEGIQYQAGSMQLEPGDKIFQYTDGAPEATNKNNELYGMERLTDILSRNASASPTELLSAVKADIDEFVGEAPQFDDITMLCLKYVERMSFE